MRASFPLFLERLLNMSDEQFALYFYPLLIIGYYLFPVLFICFVILLFGSFKNKRINIKIAAFCIVLSLIFIFIVMIRLPNIASPVNIVWSDYTFATMNIQANRLEGVKERLQYALDFKNKAKFWDFLSYFTFYPSVSNQALPVQETLETINGGSIDIISFISCTSSGSKISIHYLVRNLDSYNQEIVNMFDDGTILIFFPLGNQSQYVKYNCESCYQDLMSIIRQDDPSTENPVLESEDGIIEYYDLNCGGEQVNGWWETDSASLRDSILSVLNPYMRRIIDDAFNYGEIISEHDYFSELDSREVEYKFNSLTNSYWSNSYLEFSNMREESINSRRLPGGSIYGQ
jgi:hypothetical protein